MSDDERTKKIGEAAIKAAKEMLKSLPNNAELIEGRTVLTGKQVKEKFETDENFAIKTALQVLNLKFHVIRRNNPGKKEKEKTK